MKLLSTLVVVLVLVAIATAEKHLRGVQDTHRPHYEAITDTFTCLNKQGTFPASHVNDEFCDCADGSDEPGSSACTLSNRKPSDWKFRCTNKGFAGKEIPHSRINDRICDCCDGSDEYHGNVKCENTCAQAAEAEEKEAREREAIRQAGLKAREQMITVAKQKKAEKAAELEGKKTILAAADAKIQAAEAEKVAAETKEREEREKIHEKSKEEHAKWQIEQDEKKRAAEAAAAEAPAAEEEKKAPETQPTDPSEPPVYVCSSWRQTKHCKGDGEREASLDKGCDETINSGDSGYCACVDTRSGEERTFPKDCGHNKLTCTYVCEHEGAENDDLGQVEVAEPEFKIDDGSSFELPEARDARQKVNDATNEKATVQREVDEMEKYISGSYGPEDALLSMMDQCVEKDDGREYIYKLCPFKDVTQTKKNGGSTSMGRWKGWGEQTYGAWGGKEDYSRMIFENGDHCYSAGARQTEVHVVCGPESKLVSIEEPSMCKYKLLFETPGVCE